MPQLSSWPGRVAGWCVLAACLTACAPDVRPPAFAPREQVPLAGLPTGMAGWPEPEWWHRYHDPQLDRIIDLAMRGSPDMEQAQARYRSAQRAVEAQKAELMPKVQGVVGGTHGYSDVTVAGGIPGASGSAQGFELSPGKSWSNSGLAGALATWDLDLWGKQKAAVASAVGQAKAAEAERAVAASSLQYNVANTYFDWQAMQARLVIARRAEHAASQYRDLVALRVHAGVEDPTTLDSAEVQLAQQRRSLASVEAGVTLDQVQLAALAGVAPADLGPLEPRPLPTPDTALPPDARLGLLARRPDIAAARWQIEASARSIDQARASYYPDVSLMALGGFLRTYPDLGSGTRTDLAVGSIGPSVSLPIFSGGRLDAQFENAQAQLDLAVAGYNRAIVQAAQDVAQRIVGLTRLDAERVQQDRQLAATAASTGRVKDRRDRGIDDDRKYLSSQLQLMQQQDGQLQLQGQMLSTNLALIHALGGGYHADDLPALPAPAAKDTTR
ncbi:NodT family efflux transporter outer membrane factor (OMF) lipoprotein [Luteibacter sp. Sphag1AF]|uniref:efflux transporter outer membrane subunit n=1 Tax=Luteibacter sp. Sphag1AF TaxID=2587031 RepID=UPI00160A6C6D|nr:efflux transporter outer membrane subunit [Luteibacter sp. Sphag1AF]MBB3226561.1 NodT family efflux transporter outer membrane factor (OMF) lipoprotein [Luteibacter sp. Sphag1AF]